MKINRNKSILILVGMILILTIGCTRQAATPEIEVPTSVPTLPPFPTKTIGVEEPTATMMAATDTEVPATATPEIESPPLPLAPTDTPTTEPTTTGDSPSGRQTVQIYLVALEGNLAGEEQIGCGDQLVAVDVVIEPTVAVLRAAITELLAVDSEYYGQSGLYNALHQSDLEIDKLGLQNGLASIYLTGDLLVGGVCDAPRIQAQLEQTALQFSTVNQVKVYINDTLLEDYLSLK
jgi:hypothetical protein